MLGLPIPKQTRDQFARAVQREIAQEDQLKVALRATLELLKAGKKTNKRRKEK